MAHDVERIPTPTPGIYPGVPMAEYLAWDAWSRSEIAAMEISPEYCRWYRTERDPGDSAAATFGTLAHTALLEPHLWPPRDVVFVDGPMNKNPWAAQAKDAKARGYTPLNSSIKDRVEGLAARAMLHPYIRPLLELSNLEREVSAVARCPVSGLMLKARCDLRAPEIKVIGDLKTTTVGTDRRSFQRQMRQFNYHLSGPHYTEVFGIAGGEEYDTYLFLVLSQDPPYQPRVYSLDPLTMEAGRDFNHLLRRRVAACLASGEWPSGPEGIEPVGLPGWKLEEIQAELELEAKEA